MSETAKINMKIGEIEISIEGPSDFVSKQYDKVESHLSTYKELSETVKKSQPKEPVSPTKKTVEKPEPESKDSTASTSALPESFGEWLNIIPKGTSETDKALLAGYHVQLNSAEGYYRSRQVSKLLKDHGIKLSNPSRFVKLNAENKRSFQHSKNGSETNYKLSRDGEAYAKGLLGQGDEE
jgi:hypothetical protein